MNVQERQVIDGLFAKLREAEHHAAPRDPEAETHIRSRITEQPGAPYYMAQTIVVQEQALNAAQERIAELERELESRPAGGGGFLASLFGGGSAARPQPRPNTMASVAARPFAMPGAPGAAPGPGGGFLAGAAQTAMGVAGGVLLGNMIAGAFSSGEANAAEAGKPAAEPAAAEEADAGFDDAGFDEEV